MTEFNPDGKPSLTYNECLAPAMKIKDKEDADQYFKKYVAFTQQFLDKEPRADGITAEQICKINLGYYAGYYDQETMNRVNSLFLTTHPIFGNETTTPEKALNLGIQRAQS